MEIQEILVIPKEKNIFDTIHTNFKIWKEIEEELKSRKSLLGLNPESAWITNMDNEKCLEVARKISNRYDADIGIDFASSSIFKKGFYCYKKRKLSKDQQIDYVKNLARTFNLVYIEDPLDENDFSGFVELNNS